MTALLTLALVGVVLVVITAPMRHARAARRADPDARAGAPASAGGSASAGAPTSAGGSAWASSTDLEAAREAKYREIRDAELDYRTGKLSLEDYQAIDADLRAEAIEILDRYERAGGYERAGEDGTRP